MTGVNALTLRKSRTSIDPIASTATMQAAANTPVVVAPIDLNVTITDPNGSETFNVNGQG